MIRATLLLLIVPALGAAQINDRPTSLLREIAAAARATKNWSAEGVQVRELSVKTQLRDEIRFQVAVHGPLELRWETTGDDRSLRVCDGSDQWIYNQPGISFYHHAVTIGGCSPILGNFSALADHLIFATTIGRERVEGTSGPQECDVIRAEYDIPLSPGTNPTGRVVRVLCIDIVQKVVRREQTERENPVANTRLTETITYSKYENDPMFAANTFRFLPPTGVFEDDGPQTDLDEPVPDHGAYRPGPRVSPPQLISKTEASYTKEALVAGIAGLVLISLQVGPDGVPENLTVVRGLGHGLDEKAVEAVAQWHFRPGIKDGIAATVGPVKTAVTFRLP